MKLKVEEVQIVGFVTEVIDEEKGEYIMNFRPLRFGEVKNLGEYK